MIHIRIRGWSEEANEHSEQLAVIEFHTVKQANSPWDEQIAPVASKKVKDDNGKPHQFSYELETEEEGNFEYGYPNEFIDMKPTSDI